MRKPRHTAGLRCKGQTRPCVRSVDFACSSGTMRRHSLRQPRRTSGVVCAKLESGIHSPRNDIRDLDKISLSPMMFRWGTSDGKPAFAQRGTPFSRSCTTKTIDTRFTLVHTVFLSWLTYLPFQFTCNMVTLHHIDSQSKPQGNQEPTWF